MERGKRKRMSKAPPAAVKKQDKLFCAATWEAFDWENDFQHTFHPDQVRVARYLYTYPKLQCFEAYWDMGIGKTPLAFLWSETQMCKLWRARQTPSITIVVASPTLQANFRNKLMTWLTYPQNEREAHVRFFYRFWSMEKIGLHTEEFTRQCRNNFVLIDESHRMRTKIELHGSVAIEGKQAFSLLKGTKHARSILRCSGTPIPDNPSDLDNALLQYQQEIPKGATSSSKSKYPDVQLVKDIYKYRIRRVKQLSSDQQKKMPTICEIQCLIEMAPDFYEAYRKVEENELAELRASHNEVSLSGTAACWSGLRQAVNKINSAPSQKREVAEQLILKSKIQGKRVILSSQFLERGLDLFAKSFPKHQIRYVKVVGAMRQDDRQLAIDQFNDATAPVDVIMISNAGNFGTSLGAGQVQINVDLHWNSPTRDQTNHRGCRYDSIGNVIVIYNLMMIKPGEFDSFQKELESMIVTQKGKPGIPHQVLTFRQPAKPNDEKKKREVELESVDIRLFRLQLLKIKESAPYLQALEESSIERLFSKADEAAWAALPTSLVPRNESGKSEEGKKSAASSNAASHSKEKKTSGSGSRTKQQPKRQKKTVTTDDDERDTAAA